MKEKKPVIRDAKAACVCVCERFFQRPRWMVSSCGRLIAVQFRAFLQSLDFATNQTTSRISTYQWIVRINYICNGPIQQRTKKTNNRRCQWKDALSEWMRCAIYDIKMSKTDWDDDGANEKQLDVIKWNCDKFIFKCGAQFAHPQSTRRFKSMKTVENEKRIYESNQRIIAGERRVMWRHEVCAPFFLLFLYSRSFSTANSQTHHVNHRQHISITQSFALLEDAIFCLSLLPNLRHTTFH